MPFKSTMRVPNSTPIVCGESEMTKAEKVRKTKEYRDSQETLAFRPNYVHLFSVNWCNRQDLPTPISPNGKDGEKQDSKVRNTAGKCYGICSCLPSLGSIHGVEHTYDDVLVDAFIGEGCSHLCWIRPKKAMGGTSSLKPLQVTEKRLGSNPARGNNFFSSFF